jgi:uncharacterized DUF497 family protein
MTVWDERKRQANIAKHRLDFEELSLEFFAVARIEPSREGRFKALGLGPSGMISVIFRPLGREGLSVASMRPASRSEWRNLT